MKSKKENSWTDKTKIFLKKENQTQPKLVQMKSKILAAVSTADFKEGGKKPYHIDSVHFPFKSLAQMKIVFLSSISRVQSGFVVWCVFSLFSVLHLFEFFIFGLLGVARVSFVLGFIFVSRDCFTLGWFPLQFLGFLEGSRVCHQMLPRRRKNSRFTAQSHPPGKSNISPNSSFVVFVNPSGPVARIRQSCFTFVVVSCMYGKSSLVCLCWRKSGCEERKKPDHGWRTWYVTKTTISTKFLTVRWKTHILRAKSCCCERLSDMPTVVHGVSDLFDFDDDVLQIYFQLP